MDLCIHWRDWEMNGIVFIEMPCTDCEAQPLNGEVAYYPPEWDNPIDHFLNNMVSDSRDFNITYTAGHYGEVEHEWLFSHHEVYDPRESCLPTIVILRYRPRDYLQELIDISEEAGLYDHD
jgi:hypothetical protein